MLRQVNMILAALLGVAIGAALLIAQQLEAQAHMVFGDDLFGAPQTPIDYALQTVGLIMPLAGLMILVSLVTLEWLQPRVRAPRLIFFVAGALSITLVVGASVAAMSAPYAWLLKQMLGVVTPVTVFGVAFVIPALIAACAYVWLTKSVQPGAPDPLPPPMEAAPAAPRQDISLPIEQHTLIAVLTTPHERIGQRTFLRGIGVVAVAGHIWFLAPFLIGAFAGFEQHETGLLALSGWLAIAWLAFCVTANRLHDLGLGAAWAAAPFAAGVAWAIAEKDAERSFLGSQFIVESTIAIGLCYALTAAILLTREGETGPNRFGGEAI